MTLQEWVRKAWSFIDIWPLLLSIGADVDDRDSFSTHFDILRRCSTNKSGSVPIYVESDPKGFPVAKPTLIADIYTRAAQEVILAEDLNANDDAIIAALLWSDFNTTHSRVKVGGTRTEDEMWEVDENDRPKPYTSEQMKDIRQQEFDICLKLKGFPTPKRLKWVKDVRVRMEQNALAWFEHCKGMVFATFLKKLAFKDRWLDALDYRIFSEDLTITSFCDVFPIIDWYEKIVSENSYEHWLIFAKVHPNHHDLTQLAYMCLHEAHPGELSFNISPNAVHEGCLALSAVGLHM
ncbi:MAG: hypothetical protein LIP02_02085 [Bacteroidales bacterium]|nr:hypothetical protein [Bacteroidales bacterium]